MASKTDNIGLDLYDTGDAANLRDQYNSSMHTLDETVTVINTNATDALTKANTAIDNLEALGVTDTTSGEALKNTIENHTAQITEITDTTIPGINTNISNLEATLTQDISEVKGTADNALSLAQTNESDIADIDANLNALHANSVDDATNLYNQIQDNTANIETLTADIALTHPNLEVEGITRWSLETAATNGTNRRSVQACQYISDDVAVVYEDESTTGSNVQRLTMRSKSGVLATVNMDLGHTCSMGYDGTYLYMFNVNDANVYRSVCNPTGTLTTPTNLGIEWSGSNWCGTVINGRIYEATYLSTSPNVRVRNLSTGTIEETYTIDYVTTYPGQYSMNQSTFCFQYNDNIYVMRVFSNPGWVEIYNPFTNEYISGTPIPDILYGVAQGEIEYLSINNDGTFFMSQQDGAAPTSQMKAGALFKGNIKTGPNAYYTFMVDSGRVYVAVTDDTDYIFPHTPDTTTGYGSDNPLTVYFPQDINTFLSAYNPSCEISIQATRTDTTLSLASGDGTVSYTGGSIVTQTFYGNWRLSSIDTYQLTASIPAQTGANYMITATQGTIRARGTLTSASAGSSFLHLQDSVFLTTSTNVTNLSTYCTSTNSMVFQADA